MKNYYEILGVNRNASNDDIKAAYRKLSLKIHPDLNNGDTFFSELFKNINEAHDILSHDLKRAEYDAVFFPENAEPKDHIEEDFVKRQFEEQKIRERQEQKIKMQKEQKATEVKISMVGKMMEETYVPRKKQMKKITFPWFTLIFMAAIAVLAVKLYNNPHEHSQRAHTEKLGLGQKKKKKTLKDEYKEDERKLDEEMQRRNENKVVPIDSGATNVNGGN